MSPGEIYEFKNYKFEYVKPEIKEDEHKVMMKAHFNVYKEDKLLGQLSPAKYFYFASEQPSTEVDMHHEAFLDLYLVLGALDENTAKGDFRIMLNPLISSVWIGGIIMVCGILVVLIPRSKKHVQLALWIFLMLGALSPQPLWAAGASEDPFSYLKTDDPALIHLKEVTEKYFCECGDCVRTDLKTCTCGFSQKERAKIFGMMQSGMSDDGIEQALLNEYGPKVYAIPPRKGFFEWSYRGVYILGAAALVAGFVVVGYLIKHVKKEVLVASNQNVSNEDSDYEKKLMNELKDF
ncbi:MAG: hypothetical protein ACD_73C00543G0001 [uncultured bacterium]|nr:MAG: hypothetical protein ACD_73C00543G0001 [uncultured bacterium]